jgi:hypothetical protein
VKAGARRWAEPSGHESCIGHRNTEETAVLTSKQSRPTDPAWWGVQHTLLWEECRPELRRAWAGPRDAPGRDDVVRLGPDDALIQKHPTTPRNVSVDRAYDVADDDWELAAVWEHLEPALRFGAGAGLHYVRFAAWTEQLEPLLQKDWETTHPPGTWQRLKGAVRRGFEAARASRADGRQRRGLER